jgi:uncharacterized membrane protein
MNVLLWIIMFYSIFKIDNYTARRNSYIAILSVIFAIPLLVFLLSCYARVWTERIAKWPVCKLIASLLAAIKAVN